MKTVLCLILSLLCYSSAFSQNKEELPDYPLCCNVDISPKEIHYGDIVFATITLTNKGDKTILVPTTLCVKDWLEKDYVGCQFELKQSQKIMFRWLCPEAMDLLDGNLSHEDGVWTSPGHSLEPDESVEIGFVPIWIPRPELVEFVSENINESSVESREFKHGIQSATQKYQWNAQIELPAGNLVGPMDDPPSDLRGFPKYKPLKGINVHQMPKHGYKAPVFFQLSNVEAITVKPRSDEELALLHDWFLEIPETIHKSEWYYGGAFAHPYFVKSSPYRVSPEIVQHHKSGGKMIEREGQALISGYRRSKCGRYEFFFEEMKTRTPGTERTIARTKACQVKLFERAAMPNSTISPTMKEFITLRGFLINLRYAQNAEEQQVTYDELLDWVATTQKPSLWIKYLKWIVLNDRSHTDVLPSKDFATYQEKLKKRFPSFKKVR